MNFLTTSIHLALAVHYGYGIYIYCFGIFPPPEVKSIRNSFGGPFKYLTFIDMLMQFVYFVVGLMNDVLGSDTQDFRRSKRLQKFRDFVFTSLIFPVGAFVTVTFWGLYIINRELIFPKIYDRFFPLWLNHNIHTTPLFGALVEMWISPHAFPSSQKGFTTIASVAVVYGTWVCFIGFKTGVWVYPILQQLPLIGRAAFMVGMAILLYLFFVVGEAINRRVWVVSSKKKSKKSY